MSREDQKTAAKSFLQLSEALRLFNCPLSAEQAWSIAYSISISVNSSRNTEITIDAESVCFDANGTAKFKKTATKNTIIQASVKLFDAQSEKLRTFWPSCGWPF